MLMVGERLFQKVPRSTAYKQTSICVRCHVNKNTLRCCHVAAGNKFWHVTAFKRVCKVVKKCINIKHTFSLLDIREKKLRNKNKPTFRHLDAFI